MVRGAGMLGPSSLEFGRGAPAHSTSSGASDGPGHGGKRGFVFVSSAQLQGLHMCHLI